MKELEKVLFGEEKTDEELVDIFESSEYIELAGKHLRGSEWNFVLGDREVIAEGLEQIKRLFAAIYNELDLKVDDNKVVAREIKRSIA